MPEGTPVRVKKLGHVVFTVSDIERTTRFWTEIMGFQVSDRNERGMIFLRNGSDHHTVALVPGEGPHEPAREGQPGFHHCALEVGTVSELSMRGGVGPGATQGSSSRIPTGSTSSSTPRWIRSARVARAGRRSNGAGPRLSRRRWRIPCPA